MASSNLFVKLKCDYTVKEILGSLIHNKYLKLIRYNKYLQKRTNININCYKEYSETYSSIKIEIKPVNDKYGKFINFNEDRKYYYKLPSRII